MSLDLEPFNTTMYVCTCMCFWSRLEYWFAIFAALVFARAEFLDREWFTMSDSPDMEWYFFSPRVFKHINSKSTMINRTAKGGSWKKQGNDRRITGCSGEKIGGRRIFTFYLPKKQKTDWVIHEYYLTKADSDEQIGDFVLCRLKDNRLKKKKSGKPDHDRQDAPGDQAFNSNDDEAKAEHGGGSCSMALNVESPASKQLENVLPIRYGNDDDADHGGGSCHIVPGMLTEAEEYQGFNALQDAVFEGQPDSEMVEEVRTNMLFNFCHSISDMKHKKYIGNVT